MVFSSTIFLTAFLPVVLGLYVLMSERLRVLWLVASSLFFYAWGEPRAVLCMLAMILANYAVGRLMESLQTQGLTAIDEKGGGNSVDLTRKIILSLGFSPALLRRALFIFGVAANLAALFLYKYLDFAVGNLNALFGTAWNLPGIALPIGISFYCFQCVSYLADVYCGRIRAARRIDLFALYIAFFPALIAGPIVRYADVYRDLADRSLHLNRFAEGLQRFVAGLAKKVLIADPLGLMADKVFSAPTAEIHIVWAWIGILCYALQIYYDFSSYSDMAIGLGRVFNLKIPENFKLPYAAASIQDFWRRWHISLSSWLRDYVYIPLGGSRRGAVRTFVNIWIVFVLCGLWHGAGWPFVVWGVWHGLGLTVERLGLARILEGLPFILRNLWVWLFVLVGWVWFRSPDLAYASGYLKAMFLGNEASFWMHWEAYRTVTFLWLECLAAGLIFSYGVGNRFLAKRKDTWFGVFGTLLLFFVAWAFATTSTFSPFIYFRF